MEWHRRRDLEGGKELGVWLCQDETGTITEELYVESHEYRGDDFDTYTGRILAHLKRQKKRSLLLVSILTQLLALL